LLGLINHLKYQTKLRKSLIHFSIIFLLGMRIQATDPRSYTADRLVLSKGHTAPILYAAWSLAGLYTEEQLMTLRKFDSDLEGHPTPRLPFVDVATGSLG